MKSVILALITIGGVAIAIANPAIAQNPTGNGNAGVSGAGAFTVKNVAAIRPFGQINVYNVGVDLPHVSTWVKTLSAAERQEMAGRCSVIIANQQNYYSETTTFCQNFAIAVAENVITNGSAFPR